MRPSRWATHSAYLHGLSDRLPRLHIQPTTATSRSLSISHHLHHLLDTLTDLTDSDPYDTAAIQTQSGTHCSCLRANHPPRLIAHCLCRRYTVDHCGAARGGYGCTHVDCPNTTKAARSQPSHLNTRAMADSTGHVYGPDRPPTTGRVVAAALPTPMEPSLTRC